MSLPALVDPNAIEQSNDPGAFVLALVDQARALLDQAKGMEGLAVALEIKSRAEAIRVYTQQKDMGREAELSAAEIVRRAERRIGQLIRDGQAKGEIRRKGQYDREVGDGYFSNSIGPAAAAGAAHNADLSDAYALTDNVTDEQFEDAIAEGKAEGNLSRASVVRRVKAAKGDPIAKLDTIKADKSKAAVQARRDAIRRMAGEGHTAGQIAKKIGVVEETVREIARDHGIELTANKILGRTRRVDVVRVMSTAVLDIETAISSVVSVMNGRYGELDPVQRDEWVASLENSRQSLNRFIKSLKETTLV